MTKYSTNSNSKKTNIIINNKYRMLKNNIIKYGDKAGAEM